MSLINVAVLQPHHSIYGIISARVTMAIHQVKYSSHMAISKGSISYLLGYL